MKFLTLNTHSWMEKNPEEKFQLLLQDILENSYDLICFQEINQEITSTQVESGPLYNSLPSAEPIHQDHYVRLLVEKLAEKGLDYYWTWAYNHIGYDRFQEGVAILSKTPLVSQGILISDVDDEHDYHTRRALLGKTKIDQEDIAIVSLHMSWWNKGFQGEWNKLERALSNLKLPLLLMGDFNNPYENEGYQAILKSSLKLQDSHQSAKITYGKATIQKEIDGWQGNQEALKVDYVFLSSDWQVEKSEVIFDGKHYPMISDHCGLACQANLNK